MALAPSPEFLCPSCGTRGKMPRPVPAGTLVRCPRCGATTMMSGPGSPPIAVAPQPPVTGGTLAPLPAKEPEDEARPARRKLRKKGNKALKGVAIAGTVVLGVGLLGLVGFLIFFFWPRVDPAKITTENYDKIRVGMTLSEVRAVIGRGESKTYEPKIGAPVGFGLRLQATDWVEWRAGDRTILIGHAKGKVEYKQYRDAQGGRYEGNASHPRMKNIERGPLGIEEVIEPIEGTFR